MGNMYEWLVGLFGTDLSDYLWGYDCTALDYVNAQVYTGIGLVTIGVALLSVLCFYWWIDHPRWANRWVPWLVWGVATCGINLLIGAIWTLQLLSAGAIGECMHVLDINCWMFGLANAIDTAVLFIALSFILKRFVSKKNQHTPWRSKFWVLHK